MAEDTEETEAPEAPKPVRRVKKVLRETPPEPTEEEAPEPEPKARVEKVTAPAKKRAAAGAKPAPKRVVRKKAPAEKVEEPEEKPKPAEKEAPEKKPVKKAKKIPKKAGTKEEEAEEGEEEEEEHVVRPKPELADAVRAALRVRRQIASRRPTFYRQEWFRYKRLGLKWRKPQGGQSKLRRHYGYRINVVSIGYRGPRPARGLHPSGFEEVLVHTVSELKSIDPKRQAARIGGTVGGRMREIIQKEAEELGVRVLNRREG